MSIQGNGEFSADGQNTWRPAAVRQILPPTHYVRTLALSKMAILLPNGKQMDLDSNTMAQIMGPEEAATVRIPNGRVWGQTKSPPKRVMIETPSALAAIRGTDWELVVDGERSATISVFSGEVEFYNEHGAVTVGPNEQAMAEKGRAPVKLQLVVSRSRIQWVSSFTIDPKRYAAYRDLPDAYAQLQRSVPAGDPSPESWLLLADIEVYRGNSASARAILERGAGRFNADGRFEAALARIALIDDDLPAARRHAEAATRKTPDSPEGWLALGDIERLEGQGDRAIAAYGRAVQARAADARAWRGLGVIESERENVSRARSNLEKAIALDPADPGALAELGTLEGFAGNLAKARSDLEAAVAQQPDNYVALTGLGVVELKAGRVDESIDALLRASLIEPRYARAHLYLAVAYYQARRDADALFELARAAELDPKDPLPHLLTGIIHLDRIEPGQAAEAARRALERIPFTKSLNQVADNQKGVANVGAPLAAMGLEAWARSAAHESYLPLWGGSHLFLADRYPGAFDQRSELMQGFITDPLAFGATNRFQSLVTQPGFHATPSLRYSTSDDQRVTEPVLTLNGYDASRLPFAYFAEAIDTRIDPRNTAIDARARTYTVALGANPVHQLGLFLYANRISMDADLGHEGQPGTFTRIDGSATRVDGGIRFAPDSRSSLWFKAGASREDSAADNMVRVIAQGRGASQHAQLSAKPEEKDAALRYTIAASGTLEVTAGLEWARQDYALLLRRDSVLHFDEFNVPTDTLDQSDVDKSTSAYGLVRWGDARLRVELGAAWRDYRKERDIHVSRDVPFVEIFTGESYRRRKTDPMLGITWRASDAWLGRAACRRWLRPIALDTLAPVAVAGVPIEDQLVFPGGELEQCRAQVEWKFGANGFASANVEHLTVDNLVSPLDGVLNTRTDVTNLDRLRNRTITPPAKPDLLEDVPVFGQARVQRANMSVEQLVARSVGLRFYYTYTDSENTASAHHGRQIPYLPRHLVNLGLTWAPGWRSFVTAQAVYRSRRLADEANAVELPSGWDARINFFVESADKRWAVEAYAANLLKKQASDVVGAVVSYRF